MTNNILKKIEENQKRQKNSYIIKTRWCITASKLKDYIINPELFYLKYIIESPVTFEKDEEDHFVIWTALDDLISYWEKAFDKKYFYEKEKLLKADLEKKLVEQWVEVDKKLKVDELRDMYYWKLKEWKTTLTKTQVDWIIAMYKEFHRQPLMKADDTSYEVQKQVSMKYKNLKLFWTFDRISEKNREIRDTKTTWEVKWFLKNCPDYWYDISMSFYYWLWLLNSWQWFNLYLDVLSKDMPSCSRIVTIPLEKVADTFENIIIPALDSLSSDMEEWEKTYDSKVWLKWEKNREKLFKNEYYDQMQSTIITERDIDILI